MTLPAFNLLPNAKKKELLQQCCGSSAWVDKILQALPVENLTELLALADKSWGQCTEKDWHEAFAHHPKIGDVNTLKEKFARTADWAANEQASVKAATDTVLQELAQGNQTYEDKFGYIFIVCATGKSAAEMLALLKARLPNPPDVEINIAAAEQSKITKIRLQKLLQ